MMRTAVAHHALSREATTLALIAAVAASVVILYAQTFASITAIWQSSGYHHGLIVPPICAYLLWRLRRPLAAVDLEPCLWAVVPLIAIVALWFVARSIGVQIVEFLAAVSLIPAAVLAFLGWRLARLALFPLLFLLAAVPVGDGYLPTLMQVTADISTTLLQIVGVPVFREGQFLTLPGGTFEIARVCAGLAYLTAGTVIALLFSYFTFTSFAKRAAFVLVAATVMILTNGLRAFVIMYVASATNMRWLVGRDHVLFGWILFGAVIGALLWTGARFADTEARQTSADVAASERARLWPWVLIFGLLMLAVTAQPLQTGLPSAWLWLLPAAGLLVWALYRRAGSLTAGAAVPRGIHYRTVQGGLVLGIAPVVIAAGPSLLTKPVGIDERHEPLAKELPAIDQCHRGGGWSENWLPSFRLPDTVMSGGYVCGGQDVNVFVATYSGDTQGRELISESNKAVPDALRFRAALGVTGFTSQDRREIGVNELRVESSATPTLVWYWYRIGNRSATDPVVVKLDQALDLLLMRRAESAVYVLQTSAEASVDTGRERLARVARELTAQETSEGLPKVTLVERDNTTSP